MDTLPNTLDLIDRVVEVRQADAAQIANLLGGEPRVDTQQSNPYYVSWQVAGTPPVRIAELRLPKDNEAGRPRLIIIKLNIDSDCISRSQVVEKYGQPSRLGIPTPHQPPGSPIYYGYQQSWGELRIAIDKRECATSVVLDIEG
jgi:hypothetical protein